MYATAVFIAAFLLLRWSRISLSKMEELWDGFKWFFASIALGCTTGVARLVVHRQAYMYVFMEFSGNRLSGNDPELSAEYWQQFCTYWVPLVLLVSVEKMFITYADFQVNS